MGKVKHSGITTQNLRLITGVIMFVFAATHFLNHALGLVSYELMDAMQQARSMVTRSYAGRIVLAGAFVIHIALNVPKIVTKRSWRMPLWELTQILSGIAVPILLLPHVIGMNIPEVLWGRDVGYSLALQQLWPNGAIEKAILMFILWLHGCIGINSNIKMRKWYPRWRTSLVLLAVLIPILGFLGFTTAGKIIAISSTSNQLLTIEEQSLIANWKSQTQMAAILFVLAILTLTVLIFTFSNRNSKFIVTLTDGQKMRGARGQTLLEVSRENGVQHASVCGGRGRCSTCRFALLAGAQNIPLPSENEKKVLEKMALTGTARLACQVRPTGDLTVALLVQPSDDTITVMLPDRQRWGIEAHLTVMFADIRGFTKLSEKRLPFDVVFILNKFMQSMTKTIELQNGHVDKFMGDGIMAVFGAESNPRDGAKAALLAASEMFDTLGRLNSDLDSLLDKPLTLGIGIHSGHAVIGRVGSKTDYGAAGQLTVIGDVVNTASRIEGMCKELSKELVVSEDTITLSGMNFAGTSKHKMKIRGRNKSLQVYGFRKAW